ncbi:MAG: hypothetical protein AB7P67_14015 [Vicinamibacterales bacterium]
MDVGVVRTAIVIAAASRTAIVTAVVAAVIAAPITAIVVAVEVPDVPGLTDETRLINRDEAHLLARLLDARKDPSPLG